MATTIFDALRHAVDLVWIGRYLGIPGVILDFERIPAIGKSIRLAPQRTGKVGWRITPN